MPAYCDNIITKSQNNKAEAKTNSLAKLKTSLRICEIKPAGMEKNWGGGDM